MPSVLLSVRLVYLYWDLSWMERKSHGPGESVSITRHSTLSIAPERAASAAAGEAPSDVWVQIRRIQRSMDEELGVFPLQMIRVL